VLLLQDLLLILIIVMLAKMPDGPTAVAAGMGGTVALFALAILCQRWLMPLLVVRLKLDEETLLLSILATLFVFIALSFWMGIPIIAGAFLAGFALSAFPVNGLVRGVLGSLGLIVTVPDTVVLLEGLGLALLVLLVTPPLVTVAAEWIGLSSRSAIESGLLLAQTSELSLVLLLNGLLLGHVTPEIFSILALVTVVTMSCTPFLATDAMTERLLHLHPLHRRPAAGFMKKDHVLLLGFGAGGMWVVKPLREAGHDVLVVDDDPVVIRELQQAGIPWIYGDGSDAKTLEQAGARDAKLVIAAMRRIEAAERVLKFLKGKPVIVRLFEEEHARRVQEMGGIPILNSMAAADTFMQWFTTTKQLGRANPQPFC
jgi:CPA2 family monovalent cation:H+ antiporter-2